MSDLKSLEQFIAEQQQLPASAPIQTTPEQTTPKVKSARKAKSASKPAVKEVATHGDINFIVRGDGATKLFAHTSAWLELTGLIHGKEYPADIIRELGGSALRHHIKQGNFEESGGMAKLTAKGLSKFKDREEGNGPQRFDHVDKEHYLLMMIEGLNDERLIKNQATIRPIKPFIDKLPDQIKRQMGWL